MRLTADKIEENNAVKSEKAPKIDRRGKNPKSLANLVAPWRKGVSGNPGGQPGYDVGALIARQVLENNREAIYEALTKSALTGNAYTFKELAERGCGKLKETKEITHIHQDVPDTDLQRRIDELVRDCGLAQQVDEAGGVKEPSGRAESAQVETQDTSVLPG